MLSRFHIPHALFLTLLCVGRASGVSFRSESIEWQTDAADVVIIGSVARTKELESPNEHMDFQEVTCNLIDTIKGERMAPVTFRHNFPTPERPWPGAARRLEVGDRILILIDVDRERRTHRVVNWFNLSHPNREMGPFPHAAYNNDCRLLTDEKTILKIVRNRSKEQTKLKRGAIVMFEPVGDVSHDFVITADPKYKRRFIHQLRSENHGDRCRAISNLVSYPGEETQQLIRPMLRDTATETATVYGPKGPFGGVESEVTYYPVRQAAYLALTLLGADENRPHPYYDELRPGGFEFEDNSFYPQGRWKRWEDVNRR